MNADLRDAVQNLKLGRILIASEDDPKNIIRFEWLGDAPCGHADDRDHECVCCGETTNALIVMRDDGGLVGCWAGSCESCWQANTLDDSAPQTIFLAIN